MYKLYNIPIVIGIINLIYWAVYKTLGSYTTSELLNKNLGFIFYIIRE